MKQVIWYPISMNRLVRYLKHIFEKNALFQLNDHESYSI